MLFYDLMGYNHPEDKKYFKINPELTEGIKFYPKTQKKLSSDVSEYEKFINKYNKIFRYIPFVKNVYVSNSVSFKSIHNESDIDLFIITKNNRIFLAKLFVWIFFKILKIGGNHKKGKFCTGFWVTEQAIDLYPISIYPLDLYLAYWIAHLQPIYSKNQEGIDKIYQENLRIKQIIPNYNGKPHKILNVNLIEEKNIIGKFLEKVFGFNFLNSMLGFFWEKKMLKGKQKLGKKGKNIIISDNILKFFAPDIRKTVYLKYKTLKPSIITKKEYLNWKIKNLSKEKVKEEKLF